MQLSSAFLAVKPCLILLLFTRSLRFLPPSTLHLFLFVMLLCPFLALTKSFNSKHLHCLVSEQGDANVLCSVGGTTLCQKFPKFLNPLSLK